MSPPNEDIPEQIATLEANIAAYHDLVADIDDALKGIEEGQEAIAESFVSEKENNVSQIYAWEQEIASLKKQLASDITNEKHDSTHDFDQSAPKWDPTKHPKFRKASPDIPPPPPPPANEAPRVFNVKDVVLAKWHGDFYEATIISKTGSSADPVYTVRFTYDGTKENKRKHEVRAMPNKKRKAEGPPSALSTPPVVASPQPPTNGAIISAPPVVDTSLIQKREPSMVSDGPTRMKPEKKKLKGNKQLEGKQNNWQSFMKNGPKKSSITAVKPKESMFRTPDAPSARVGVIGSGKGITKDQSRAKWGGGGGSYSRDRDDRDD